uniref:Uncharacterized protein n=2 Tax=Oryza sativa subsp. japonica TaxID=39947 RepID=Q6Z2I2_ORYSJ|nr:hypothetical protein [Oryza sativa Japonica Group]
MAATAQTGKAARPRASHQCVCPCWWRQCTRQVRGTADAHRTHRWTDARARRDGARGHGLSSSAVRRGGHHHAPLGGAVASDLYRLVSARAGRGGVKLGRGVGLQRLDTAVAGRAGDWPEREEEIGQSIHGFR